MPPPAAHTPGRKRCVNASVVFKWVPPGRVQLVLDAAPISPSPCSKLNCRLHLLTVLLAICSLQASVTMTTVAAGHSDPKEAAAGLLLGSASPAAAHTPTAAAGHSDHEAVAGLLLLGAASPAASAATQAAGAAGRAPAIAVDVTSSGPSPLPLPSKDTAESSSSTTLTGEHM